MELKRNRCESVCIFFMYFLANNSKILSSYRLSPILLSRPSVRPGQRSVRVWKLVEVGETLARRWRETRGDPSAGQRSKVGAEWSSAEPVFRWPRFPIISHVSFSRACIDSGSSTRLSRRPIVDIRKGSESEIGEGESQRWNRHLFVALPPFFPLLVQPCSFHLPRACFTARVRVRVRV